MTADDEAALLLLATRGVQTAGGAGSEF